MSLNETPSGERVHIGFFGRRNAGKSSLVNAVTGQELSVVSDVRGTTTDPVTKSMELLPLGPVVIIDTPGYDDEGALGEKRVAVTRRALGRTDVAVLVADASSGMGECERELEGLLREGDINYIIAYNKADLAPAHPQPGKNGIYVSALTGEGIAELKERIARLAPAEDGGRRLVGDLVRPGAPVVLVTPIDSAAPKGRMILPQQQMLRDLLDAGVPALVTRETELTQALGFLKEPPQLVITDSQAFEDVARDTPVSVPLTSFSILMARYKGLLDAAVAGVTAIDRLVDGDRVLIAEGCTHHRQCGDIGTVKLPRWIAEYTGKKIIFDTSSGSGFPTDLSPYKLIIHCGGCMLGEREVRSRVKFAGGERIPITNYGILIAYMKGILRRSLSPLPETAALLGR